MKTFLKRWASSAKLSTYFSFLVFAFDIFQVVVMWKNKNPIKLWILGTVNKQWIQLYCWASKNQHKIIQIVNKLFVLTTLNKNIKNFQKHSRYLEYVGKARKFKLSSMSIMADILIRCKNVNLIWNFAKPVDIYLPLQ